MKTARPPTPCAEKGYNMNDIIGISGLESAYEDELRGKEAWRPSPATPMGSL